MIYLVSKIILSLLAALGIGFGMAWMLQMHLAARLREQLNSVIFETKSRIPQLESEITTRDQAIDGLREELATASRTASKVSDNKQTGSKEQEKQIDELRQKVIDLESELQAARNTGDNELVFELDEEDRKAAEEPELMSDDEFLTDIQDIFDDADDSVEVFAGPEDAADSPDASKAPAAEATNDRQSIEDELQSELDGWDKKKIDDAQQLAKDAPADDAPAQHSGTPPSSDLQELQEQVVELTESRKELNEVVDTQAKELAGMQQQRELQDKSLTVLNQQLELARMANERILRELRELKDGKSANDDTPRSATGS